MMVISGLAFSGLALLVWYIITHFISLGALNAFWIFLALGPIYFLAAGTFRKANDSSSYQSFGSLQFGRVLAIIGLVLFPVLSFSPFFVAWRATSGFWPRTLLIFLFLWLISCLIYALHFFIMLGTSKR
jgi:uncharacterized membrane protein